MAQSKINETEFPGVAWRREISFPALLSVRKRNHAFLLLKKIKFLLFLFHSRAFVLSNYLGI